MGAPWVDTASWAVVGRLSEVLGRDLAGLLLDADTETLLATRNAQAATFALSLVALDRVRSLGLIAGAVAGHSLGEYTALVAGAVLSDDAAMQLVAARGEAMQTASEANPGTMAAVLGASPEAVGAACIVVDGVWVANDNAPGQVVVAGTYAGIDAVEEPAKKGGATRVMPLAVGGAFHSPLMKPAQEPLDAVLRTAPFGDAKVPVVTNVDAVARTSGEWAVPLSAQLCQPVRWRESLLALTDLGITTFVEIGPGDALTGMVKRTVSGANRYAVATPEAADALAAAVA
jgi:[acyl-carrier-protein] S-malonyltransferase